MLCGRVAMEGHDVDDQVARDDEENNNIHRERERLTRSRSTWVRQCLSAAHGKSGSPFSLVCRYFLYRGKSDER